MSKHFDEAAKTWDEKPDRLLLAEAIAKAIIDNVPLRDDMQAMEFGCGTGLVGLQIAPLVKHLTAMDNSNQMLKTLNDKIANMGIKNIETLFCDDKTRHENARYDFIFSSMVLHHIADPAGTLNKFAQWLKPAGYLAIADLDVEDGSFHRDSETNVHHGFDRDELSAMLQKCGFAIQKALTTYVIKRQDVHRQDRDYPVFLITAQNR